MNVFLFLSRFFYVLNVLLFFWTFLHPCTG